MTKPLDLVFAGQMWSRLTAHLFPGDRGEHGAVISAGIHRGSRADRLLARDLFLAREGVDYIPGKRGYRALSPAFIGEQIIHCRDEQLAYIAIHNHGGSNEVEFSPIDLASHERGYPALLDIARGQLVGAAVIANGAVAGDIWSPDGTRRTLRRTLVVGENRQSLYPSGATGSAHSREYDRQSRIFGDLGQDTLRAQRVGVIGAGGVGSIVVELLARLGVGSIVLVDPDRIEVHNVPRVVGSRRRDAAPWLERAREPAIVRGVRRILRTPKVNVARRVAREAQTGIRFTALKASFLDEEVARQFLDCDYLFLAADSMQARFLFNAIVHQYLIPGTQIGAKVEVDSRSGALLQVLSAYRPVTPDSGCLWCNGLIPPARLQDEALTDTERRGWRYVDDDRVVSPSVITLNAVGASLAVNDYLMRTTGLRTFHGGDFYNVVHARRNEAEYHQPRRDNSCLECGLSSASRFARGDSVELPTRAPRGKAH